jgi:hypothetical protein
VNLAKYKYSFESDTEIKGCIDCPFCYGYPEYCLLMDLSLKNDIYSTVHNCCRLQKHITLAQRILNHCESCEYDSCDGCDFENIKQELI